MNHQPVQKEVIAKMSGARSEKKIMTSSFMKYKAGTLLNFRHKCTISTCYGYWL